MTARQRWQLRIMFRTFSANSRRNVKHAFTAIFAAVLASSFNFVSQLTIANLVKFESTNLCYSQAVSTALDIRKRNRRIPSCIRHHTARQLKPASLHDVHISHVAAYSENTNQR